MWTEVGTFFVLTWYKVADYVVKLLQEGIVVWITLEFYQWYLLTHKVSQRLTYFTEKKTSETMSMLFLVAFILTLQK